MKRIVLLSLLFLSSFFLFAKGRGDEKLEPVVETVEITGIISMYGNMPFTFPGIETEDGKRYSLVSEDKKLEKRIRECAGKRVKVTGVINLPLDENQMVFQMLKDGFFYADSFEKIKPEKIKK